jgi:fluoroacetyl-CoA thioesterase
MKTISLHTIKEHRFVVRPTDVASFNEKVVHPVCATFALAREIEWTTRLFVLEMIEPDEEGVGTSISIDHKSPAFAGEEIIFTAKIDQLVNHELICSYEATVKGRLIAIGKTGQKILKREKIDRIFSPPSNS